MALACTHTMNDGLLLFLALVAGIGFVWFAASFATGLRAERWPTVPGRILAADAELSGTVSARGPFGEPHYVPRIRYEYEINGRAYRGERIRFGGAGFMSLARAREELREWPVGTEVSVAYDPRDPMNATLERGADAAYAIWACSCALIALVFLGGYMGWIERAGT